MLKRGVFVTLGFIVMYAELAVAQVSAPRPRRSDPTDDTIEFITLSGRVVFSQEFKPAERVRVKLTTITGALVGMTYTDERGHFDFLNLKRAVYMVHVEEAGFTSAPERVDMLRGSRGDAVLMLEKVTDTSFKPAGAARSVRELQIPDKAQKEFDRGMALLYEKDQPQRSLEHFQKAIQLYSDFDAAYVQAGIAHLRLGEVAAAGGLLEQGVDVNPEYAPARVLLGTVYNSLGRHQEAIEMLERAAALGNVSWQIEYEHAKALVKLGEFDGALPHAQRAFEMKPDAAEPHLQLYNLQVQRRDYGAALGLLESFLQRYPQHSAAVPMRRVEPELRAAVAAASNRP